MGRHLRLALLAALTWGALLGFAALVHAESGSLQACTTTGSPCQATVVSNLADMAVSYHVVAGTAAVTLQGQVRDAGDAWQDIQALTTDVVVRLTGVRFYALRAKPTACSGCTYTLTFNAFAAH